MEIQQIPTVSVPKPRAEQAPAMKRVWYGVGRAVESQSPAAWQKRIVKVINKDIYPNLTESQQRWVKENQQKITEAAGYAGVGITTAELVAAVSLGVWTKDQILRLIEDIKQRNIRAHTQWVKLAPGEAMSPVTVGMELPSNRYADALRKQATGSLAEAERRVLEEKKFKQMVRKLWLERYPGNTDHHMRERFTGTVMEMYRLADDPGYQTLVRQALRQRKGKGELNNASMRALFDYAYNHAAGKYRWNDLSPKESRLVRERLMKRFPIVYKRLVRHIRHHEAAAPAVSGSPLWEAAVKQYRQDRHVQESLQKVLEGYLERGRVYYEPGAPRLHAIPVPQIDEADFAIDLRHIRPRPKPEVPITILDRVKVHLNEARVQKEKVQARREWKKQLVQAREKKRVDRIARMHANIIRKARDLEAGRKELELHDARLRVQRLQATVRDAVNEALDRPLQRYTRLLRRAAEVDPGLAYRQPEVMAALAGKVATLRTNERTSIGELAPLLARLADVRTEESFAGPLENLWRAHRSHNTGEATRLAAQILDAVYHLEPGVKKVKGAYDMTHTRFTTLAAFWVQRLDVVGLRNILER